ncbi:MarR family transcriptional regulator [Paraburkholderia azotifigens]|uniref:HTH marR-type domain-containing protein n=1 Tax=Paraburkholderia azotifigens TaxID=2057004 RepID=A0A5C6VAX8_9BURK|nr:hypothetical protein [Paraburkholderia azotifigens]TXC80765.1 hypothetical protein FRZ40_41775 [Paraburkholderia azotifigens]
MKRANGWDKVEAREAIRQAAYELSNSGMCERWQDVWHALRGRFDVEQLTTVFDNPLCQIDIEQRCYRARNPGRAEGELRTDLPVITPRVEEKRDPLDSRAIDWKMRKVGLLAARILDMLSGGIECTAMDLAQRLGVSRNEVFKAVRLLLAEGTLEITKCVAAKRGGRGARVFARAAATTALKDDEFLTQAPWNVVDPLAMAFHSMARGE